LLQADGQHVRLPARSHRKQGRPHKIFTVNVFGQICVSLLCFNEVK